MFEMQSTTINIRVKTKSPCGFSFFVFQNDIFTKLLHIRTRIYRFGCGNREKVYIASADYMTRNTIRRVEVAVPILDEKLRARLDSQELFYEQAYAAEKRL